MIELPFWSSGRRSSARPARGPEPISRRSFAIFVSDTATTFSAPEASTRPSRAACASNGSAGGEISRPVSSCEQRADARRELGMRVQPGADGGAAERDLAEPRQRVLDARDALAHLRRVAAELLAERDRHGVHQVRAAGLDDVVELRRLRLERRRRAARAPAAGRSSISPSAARWTAEGKTSFEDWPRLTSSFACTSSPASVAITSFAFMFEEVPEPVWKTSIGNWSSSSPAATRSPAAAMRRRLVGVEQPEVGVHARRGGLDPPEPARDRAPGSARRRPGSSRPPCGSRRPRARVRSSVVAMRPSLASACVPERSPDRHQNVTGRTVRAADDRC